MATTLIDLTNQQIGDFKVLHRANNRKEVTYWLCECVLCGLQKEINAGQLRKPTALNHCKCRQILKNGTKFGHLTIIGIDTQRTQHNRGNYYFCQCDCGKIISVKRAQLTRKSGYQTSCGCALSQGEDKIRQILNDNNILFQQQYQFNDLISKHKLRFDFGILDENNKLLRLIEFDGYLHFGYKDSGWMTKERHEECQYNDNLKNQYVKEHNIPLVRIPYTELNNLNINMLLGDEYLI